MTIHHMTSAQYRELHGSRPIEAAPKRKKSKAIQGPWHTRCRTCGHESTTEAGQERHCTGAKHPTYEVVLTPRTPTPATKEKL